MISLTLFISVVLWSTYVWPTCELRFLILHNSSNTMKYCLLIISVIHSMNFDLKPVDKVDLQNQSANKHFFS